MYNMGRSNWEIEMMRTLIYLIIFVIANLISTEQIPMFLMYHCSKDLH